jgi:hypothetical protein
MDLLDLKRWHWMLIGLVAGALWSASRLFYGFDLPNDDGPVTLQRNFAWLLVATERAPAIVLDEGSNIYLSDLQLHPPVTDAEPGAGRATKASGTPVQWVTGTLHRHRFRQPMSEWSTSPFRYKAALPYVPSPVYDPITQDWIMAGRAKPTVGYQKPQQATYATVQDYLKEVHRKYGPSVIPYRYCWWETRAAILTIYPLGGLVIIGIIWPTLLALLTATGLATKKHADGYDLSRFKGTSKPTGHAPARSTALTAEEEQRIATITAEYEKNLQPAGDRPPMTTASTAAEPVVRALSGAESSEQASPRKAAPAKNYGADAGDYYPTEIHKSGDEK